MIIIIDFSKADNRRRDSDNTQHYLITQQPVPHFAVL
jgi:hypothetical protein